MRACIQPSEQFALRLDPTPGSDLKFAVRFVERQTGEAVDHCWNSWTGEFQLNLTAEQVALLGPALVLAILHDRGRY